MTCAEAARETEGKTLRGTTCVLGKYGTEKENEIYSNKEKKKHRTLNNHKKNYGDIRKKEAVESLKEDGLVGES